MWNLLDGDDRRTIGCDTETELSVPVQVVGDSRDFGGRIADKPELVTCDLERCRGGVYQAGAVCEPKKPGNLTGQFLDENRLLAVKIVERYARVVTGLVKPPLPHSNQLAVRRPRRSVRFKPVNGDFAARYRLNVAAIRIRANAL